MFFRLVSSSERSPLVKPLRFQVFFAIPMASERSGELVIRSDFWDPNMYQIIQGWCDQQHLIPKLFLFRIACDMGWHGSPSGPTNITSVRWESNKNWRLGVPFFQMISADRWRSWESVGYHRSASRVITGIHWYSRLNWIPKEEKTSVSWKKWQIFTTIAKTWAARGEGWWRFFCVLKVGLHLEMPIFGTPNALLDVGWPLPTEEV